MVRLDRITMQGFKSFAGKTTIPFPSGFNVLCGPNGSGKCLDYDTTVLLADGKEVKIGELVEGKIKTANKATCLDDGIFVENTEDIKIISLERDLKLRARKIKKFIKRKAPEKMLKIRTRSGREIITTKYHPFFSITENGIFSLKAEEIREGVRIATPRVLLVGNKTEIDLTSLEDLYVPFSEDIRDSLKLVIEDSGLTQQDFSKKIGISPLAVKGLLDKQSVKVDNLIKMLPSIEITSLKSKSANKIIRVSSVVTPEIARFLGYVISEGRSTNSNQIWFVNEDESIIEDFVKIAKAEFATEAKIFSYKKGCKDVIIFSKPLQTFLDKIMNLEIGSISSNKCVPEIIKQSNSEVICNFLSALFDGDGYLHYKRWKNKTQIYLEYSTASKLLACDIQTLLLRMGIISYLKEKTKYASNTKNKTKRKYYFVFIYGEEAVKFLRSIKLRNSKKSEIAKKIIENYTYSNPNLDTIPNLNKLIKYAVKEAKINIKKSKISCPKLQPYYENRCDFSREGLKEVIGFIEENGELNPSVLAVLDQLRIVANSDVYWDEIVKVEELEPNREWVYDLEVEETHNYIANNLLVHNSNIIDALTFVLGTSSARTIRAQKLQNLIFNGGPDRKPAEYCEVSLYLDNSNNMIPINEKEIKLTRKISRSGISIYKLNGKTVTRNKILDLLSNAGLSPDGYNIIMQGDVTKIIEMNPQERKQIIDDVAGISEFDEKREKAAREMERVEFRVRESMIVVAEKQKLVQRLKAEKENAEKYAMLSDKLKTFRASLLRKKLTETTEKTDIIEKEVQDKTSLFDDKSRVFTETEKELENRERTMKKIDEEIIQKTENIDILRKIDSLKTEILRKGDKIGLNEMELSRLKEISVSNVAIKEVLRLKMKGVYDTVDALVDIPEDYSIALEVAIGRHAKDIVVTDEETATRCIKHLKEKKIGMARFLPLSRMQKRNKRKYSGKEKIIGYAIDLIKFDKKFLPAMEYILSSTLVVENIDIAKSIRSFRVVTLDGDLIELSGAMIGGFYRKKSRESYAGRIRQIDEENEKLASEIRDLEKELAKHKVKEEGEKTAELREQKEKLEKEIEALRKKWKGLFEEKMLVQNAISKLKIDKARLEATSDGLQLEMEEFKDVKDFESGSVDELQEKVRYFVIEINRLGPVNMKAIEEYKTINVEFEELKKNLDKLLEEKDAILGVVNDIEKRRYDKFMETFGEISNNFSTIYYDMAAGSGTLRLEEENNIDSGLVIEANPSGKRVLNLDSMSGGEKTLTSLAFLFAVMQHYSAPFYVLDEIDAALDKTNTKKIADLIKKYSAKVQFIVISHNDLTIAEADKVFGISMEHGISKVFGIEMPLASAQ